MSVKVLVFVVWSYVFIYCATFAFTLLLIVSRFLSNLRLLVKSILYRQFYLISYELTLQVSVLRMKMFSFLHFYSICQKKSICYLFNAHRKNSSKKMCTFYTNPLDLLPRQHYRKLVHQ